MQSGPTSPISELQPKPEATHETSRQWQLAAPAACGSSEDQGTSEHWIQRGALPSLATTHREQPGAQPGQTCPAYLVGAVQRANEEGYLLYHSQVLLQVLQLLEEARGAEVHFIWAEKRLNSVSRVGKALTRTQALCKKEGLSPWGYGTRDTEGNTTRLSP